ncbi:hypothetical protein TNIN_336371 [Trichonephila inaurata madagascariensis]|uniref:Uncharacterized protein n=1 Tax=Trichonephila inaurata madagascariensis TaxID=2747483 RepID=A0A8X6WZ83_9ARAC|nr:hypothetical protein TNIN_336371 [Trichonephila inaurata madagascariensis]
MCAAKASLTRNSRQSHIATTTQNKHRKGEKSYFNWNAKQCKMISKQNMNSNVLLEKDPLHFINTNDDHQEHPDREWSSKQNQKEREKKRTKVPQKEIGENKTP